MEKEKSNPTAAPQAIKRLAIGINVLTQVLVFAAIAAMVNYVSFRHFKRWDFSRNQKFALADLTKNVLTNLKKPVKAVVFFPSAQGIAQDVASLLREYEYASDKKVSVEIVDPYRNLLRARELSEKYKFGSSDNIVILDYEGKSKFVNAMDMAEMDTSRAMFGQPPTVRAFKGEEAITSALLEITEEKQSKAYFITGHGEPAPTGQEVSALKTFIDRQNIRSEVVNLSNVDSVPADASVVVLLYPRTDLSEREIKLLSAYWTEKNGRLLVLLGANFSTPRLNEWLAESGAKPQQDVVLRTGTMLSVDRGQPTLKQGVVNTAVGITPPASKPILKELVGINVQLAGLTQSIAIDQAKASAAKVRVTPLLTSTPEYWGETEFSPQDPQAPTKDPSKDHVGQLNLAVALERGGLDDARVKVDTGRLILAGNAAFILNDGLRVSEAGLYFVLNGVNWLVNREQISGIPPKSKQAISLSLDETQMGRLALAVMGIIPAIVALFGAFIWWKRRTV
jgi:hypothetical protein